MFDRIMGKYLIDKGRLTKAQLSAVYQVQESKRAKLGVIAVSEKLMTVAQAEEINALQATMDKRFGDLCVGDRREVDRGVARALVHDAEAAIRKQADVGVRRAHRLYAEPLVPCLAVVG